MSGTGKTTSAAAVSTMVTSVLAAAKSGAATSVTTVIQDLSADTFGLLGEEAENFGNFIDAMAMDVETGMTWTAAWEKESPAFLKEAWSELYNAGINGLKQVVTVFDNAIKAFEAAI